MNGNENDRQHSGVRVGDSEREEAVRRLGDHYEAGRLAADEHAERVDQALRAKTQGDLDALFADLPRDGSGQRQRSEGPAGGRAREHAGPPWTRPGWQGRRFAGFPVPLLVLASLAAVLGVACTVAGGHPPFLLLALLGISASVAVRRVRGGRA